MTYTGVPNRKRKLYVDESGNMVPLNKMSGAAHNFIMPASGTIHADGTLTVTGTQFKYDSFIYASYESATSRTLPLTVQRRDGSAHFAGDASTGFFYFVVNA